MQPVFEYFNLKGELDEEGRVSIPPSFSISTKKNVASITMNRIGYRRLHKKCYVSFWMSFVKKKCLSHYVPLLG